MADLIHRRTRDAFREFSSDMGVVRQIDRAFTNEGLDPAPDSDGEDWYAPGQRRGTFDRYTAEVDWSDPVQVRLVLNAFEEIMRWGTGQDADSSRLNLRRLLARDGFAVYDDG